MMDAEVLTVLNLIADDKEIIAYRKRLNKLTGSVTASILLQQIIYWSKIEGFEPFFKFRGPCKHPWYKPGDSWTEELGFSPAEFDTAIKKIGTKITTGMSKSDEYQGTTPQHLVIYWTDSSRVSWYHLNADLLGKSIISIYLENQESQFTKKDKNPDLPSSETTPETTPKNPSLREQAQNGEMTAETEINLLAGYGRQGKQGIADPSQDIEAWMQTADEFIDAYHQHTGLWPDTNVQKPDIKQLAADGIDPALWDQVVRAWVGLGWNKRNVTGMIDYCRRGEIPTTGKGAKNGGNSRRGSTTGRKGATSADTLTEQQRRQLQNL